MTVAGTMNNERESAVKNTKPRTSRWIDSVIYEL
jgi:hypothetical protein